MKKNAKLLFIFCLVFTATLNACKKDTKSERDLTLEKLAANKWYFNLYGENNCYGNSDYLLFNRDGSFGEFTALQTKPGTFTLSEDGKKIDIKYTSGEVTSYTIEKISDTALQLYVQVQNQTYIIKLSTTPNIAGIGRCA